MKGPRSDDDAILFCLYDKLEEPLFKNFEDTNLLEEFSRLPEGKSSITRKGLQLRARKELGQGHVFCAVSNDDGTRNSSRLFDENFGIFKAAGESLMRIREGMLSDLLHDLPALHAGNVQSFSLLVPEESFLKGFHEQLEDLKQMFLSQQEDFARLLLNTIRNNRIISAEFKFIRLLNGGNIQTKIRAEKLHPVIQSLLYLYYPLFDQLKVRVRNGPCENSVEIDYETFVGGLIPVFNNLRKYAKEGSEITFSYKQEKSQIVLDIHTHSLGVPEAEQEEIFKKGVSGSYARELKKEGKGLGMYHARALLALSNTRISFKAGEILEDGYGRNVIKITLPASV